MFDLIAILTGTALLSMLAGFIWARLDRKAQRPRDWDNEPHFDTYSKDYHDRLNR